MGESKLKLAKREEMLLSCAGVQTMAGRVKVRWESESAATPIGAIGLFHRVSQPVWTVESLAGKRPAELRQW